MGAAPLSDPKPGAQTLSQPGTQTQAPTQCSTASDCLLPALCVSKVPWTPQTPTSFPRIRTCASSSHGTISLHPSWHIPGGQGGPAAMPHPMPFAQPCSFAAASHLAAAKVKSQLPITVLHPSLSSPPHPHGYRLSLCPSPAPQCKGQLSLAWQGAFLLSCTVYYSKRGIWLGEETRGQLACREAGLAG